MYVTMNTWMNQKVCRLTMDDGWSIIPVFNSALVSACALWPTAYRGPSEYMLALDCEIAFESIFMDWRCSAASMYESISP